MHILYSSECVTVGQCVCSQSTPCVDGNMPASAGDVFTPSVLVRFQFTLAFTTKIKFW